MNALTLGIVVFIVGHVVIASVLFSALNSARREGVVGNTLLMRLLPALAADAAWTLIFIAWFLVG